MKAFIYNEQTLELIIRLKVSTNSKITKFGPIITIYGTSYIKLLVASLPIENKANETIISFISKNFNIPKSHISIVKGNKSNKKVFLVKNVAIDHLKFFLNDYMDK